MPPFKPASKVVAHLVLRQNLFRQRGPNYCNYNQFRCLSGVAGNSVFSSPEKISNTCNVVFQGRGFLGCFDGEEGNPLSKVYEERRIFTEQLFNVVAAVDMYQDFLPRCQRSEIIRRDPDGTIDAELEIGFRSLVESYVSHVELSKPKYIKSSLFDHLMNVWEFNPGPVTGTSNLYFWVDFKFLSPFYRQVANMFFKEVVSRLVGSFNDRCQLIYGPGVPVLENTHEHKA
ncbi:Oligoketide cyclase/lipid transport protein [Handroanthus impetiginosus]|uniref:Oligoketide cyclase/lipid transport protein n=1 Tax=Handroanthus impetiginosus TaxID=429701 RepID=A0A2G9I673_9LAMI|nr:Oligoketide cyclase/lipid transport protein [Handroanthus impetiginosus]